MVILKASAGSKTCSRCGKIKEYISFGESSRSLDGLHSYCIECGLKTASNRALSKALGEDVDPQYAPFKKPKSQYGTQEYRAEYQKAYRAENGAKILKSKREALRAIRLEGIQAYGGKCSCCGESEKKFLTLDHINGVLESEPRHGGERITGQKIWRYLRQNGWPTNNYQILCWNCNCAKSIYGECPHKQRKGE